MTTEVALSRVGVILGLEISRLARNNADWYQLLDLYAMTDTLIGDADGVYHPGLFNDHHYRIHYRDTIALSAHYQRTISHYRALSGHTLNSSKFKYLSIAFGRSVADAALNAQVIPAKQ
jgi:hypothetical protein